MHLEKLSDSPKLLGNSDHLSHFMKQVDWTIEPGEQ